MVVVGIIYMHSYHYCVTGRPSVSCTISTHQGFSSAIESLFRWDCWTCAAKIRCKMWELDRDDRWLDLLSDLCLNVDVSEGACTQSRTLAASMVLWWSTIFLQCRNRRQHATEVKMNNDLHSTGSGCECLTRRITPCTRWFDLVPRQEYPSGNLHQVLADHSSVI